MKVSFFYDGPLSYDKNNNYYGIAINNNIFNRFTSPESNDTLKVYIRTNKVEESQIKNLTRITKENLEITSCPNLSSISGKIFDTKKAKKIISDGIKNSDLVYIRLPSMIGLIAVEQCKKLNKDYLIEMVGCPYDAYSNHSLKGRLIAPYVFLKTKFAVKNAPYVNYVTKKFLQNRYPTNGENISCSDVSLPDLDDNILLNRLEKINRKNDATTICTTAAVDVLFKGQEYVIKAIADLNKEGYNYEYLLIGGGDNTYLKNIAKKHNIESKVTFLGALPHKEIFKCLDNIDIYVQPSKQEGLPRALVEAMSRGCLALGSSTGGIPELINSDYIFNKGSVSEICDILKKVDKEKLFKEAKRNFKKSKEFNEKELSERRKEFYNNFRNKNKTV